MTLKLLAITTSFPRGAGDPSGQFVEALASTLRPAGFDTRVVALSRGAEGALTTLEHGTTRDRLALLGQMVREAPLAFCSADLVLAHWLIPSVWLARLRPGRPIVGVIHGSDGRILERLPKPLRRATLAGLSGLIAVTPELAGAFAHPRTLVTPMGTTLTQVSPRSPRDGVFEALFVGRLVPSKGLQVLLDATAELDGVRLTVIGDGPERRRYRALGAVRFLGPCSPAVVREAMRQAHVLCVPSVGAEGAPTVVQEAASVGLPVLASRLGGLVDVVPAGGLVSPGDVVAWREALLRAARGVVAAPTVVTWDAVGGRVGPFLREVLSWHRCARLPP